MKKLLTVALLISMVSTSMFSAEDTVSEVASSSSSFFSNALTTVADKTKGAATTSFSFCSEHKIFLVFAGAFAGSVYAALKCPRVRALLGIDTDEQCDEVLKELFPDFSQENSENK